MFLGVAPVAYRSAMRTLESPKGLLPVSVEMSVGVPLRSVPRIDRTERPGGRQPARSYRVLTKP
jgi:hypothetical protein